jgi:hypothetical protein
MVDATCCRCFKNKKMQIEKLPNIRLGEKVPDTKWIYATYRIFSFGVKP